MIKRNYSIYCFILVLCIIALPETFYAFAESGAKDEGVRPGLGITMAGVVAGILILIKDKSVAKGRKKAELPKGLYLAFNLLLILELVQSSLFLIIWLLSVIIVSGEGNLRA